jgi:cytochrome P450
MIAGFDTTANTLTFLFRQLAIQKDLQTELRNELRRRSSAELSAARDSGSSSLLKRVVREALRMYPAAAAGSVRQVHADIQVANKDIVIPAGSIAITTYYAIQRDEDVFADPDQFLPSRWEEPTDDQLRSYLTFSAGRRNCQGQALAYAELHEILSVLVAKYEFDIVEPGEPQNIVLFKPIGTLLSAKVTQ